MKYKTRWSYTKLTRDVRDLKIWFYYISVRVFNKNISLNGLNVMHGEILFPLLLVDDKC
jgi:hypothetical protein